MVALIPILPLRGVGARLAVGHVQLWFATFYSSDHMETDIPLMQIGV